MADLVPDDEAQEQPRRRYIIPGPNRPVYDTALPPQPPELPPSSGETLPSTGAIPPPPTTLKQRLESRESVLMGKLNPPPAQTRLGKVGRVLGTIGQDIGTAVAPQVMESIPGTIANRRAELQSVREALGQEQARETLGQTEQARTAIEQQRADIEARRAGLPHMYPVGEGTYRTVDGRPQNLWEIPGAAPQWVDEGGYPKLGEQLTSIPGATLPGTRTAAAPPPPTPEGQLPRTSELTPTPMAPPTPGGAAQPVIRYGKPPVPLTEAERKQANQEFADSFARLNKGEKVPESYQLPVNATKEDYDRIAAQFNRLETAIGTQANREFTQEMAREREDRAKEEAARKKEEAGAKLVRAVDNENKVHYMSRGDYDANARNFHPNPMSLPQTEIDKVTDHNTVLNEMQGRLNAAAESARAFSWDPGQLRLVMQAMGDVERSYVDQVIGIPIMDFVRQNIKKWGLEGATNETRQYLIDLLSLREAMLGMPKEITGGSRLMEKSVQALYVTLPSGTSPDLDFAMRQMRTTQSIMDRLRGSRVPIIDGMRQTQKVPDLYQHSLKNPKTGEEIFTDDGKEWFDESGRPVSAPARK